MSKRNTPALRFEGFDGEWVSTTFGETAQLSRGLTYSPRDVVNANEGVRVYRSSNIQNLSVVTSPDDVWVNPKAVDIPFLTEGNILITASNGSVRLVGKSGIVKKLSAPGVPGGFMLKCVSALPTFTAGLLQSPWYKDFLNVHVAGGNGAIGNLDSKRLSDEMVSLPSTTEEQRAIGELFADLDALIEQHRAKHANLQQTKTALLQRMFPQDGADEPELRLDGFSGPWTLRQLGEFEITTGPFGSTLHAEDYVEHGTPIVTTEHFKSGLLPLTGQGVPQVSDDDRCRLKAYWLQTNDIVFSRVGSVDINARVTELQNGWLFSGRVLRVRPDATCESQFLHSVLETDPVRGSIRKRAVGMSMPSINTAILANTSFYQPSTLEEQRAIGEVFADLDALIAAEQRYITQLTQAKTALLQRMFV